MSAASASVTPLRSAAAASPGAASWARHPHVFFRPEEWPAIRARTEHPRFRRDWESLRHVAELDLAVPPLVKDRGDRFYVGAKRASRCAFVGAVTGEERFRRRALAYFDAILAEDDWSLYVPGGADNRFGQWPAHTCHYLAMAYDLLAADMPAARKTAIVEACHRQLVVPFLGDCQDPESDHLGGVRSMNHLGSRASGAGCLLVALDGEGVDYSREIEIARAHILRFIEWYDDAGGSLEIGGYWCHGMGNALRFLVALRANGFPKIFRQRSCKLQRTAYPLLLMSVGDRFAVNFSDSTCGPLLAIGDHGFPELIEHTGRVHGLKAGADPRCAESYARPAMMILAAEFRDPRLQWYADRCSHGGGEFALICGDPELTATPPDDLPTCVAYGGCGVGVMRSSLTDPEPLLMGLKAGRARGTVYDDPHCQFDLNSVLLEAFGSPLLADPGYGHRWDSTTVSHLDPTHYTNATPPHNTVLVDGAGQLYEHNPIAHLQNLSPADDVDYLVSRVEQGYGPKVRKFDRHAYMIAGEFWVLVDEVELAGPGALTWNFHAVKEATLEPGSPARIANGGAELRLQPFGGPALVCRRADDHVLPRLQWDAAEPATGATVGWLLLVRRRGGEFPEVTAEFRDGRVLVTSGSRRWTLPVASRRAAWRSDIMLPFGGKCSPDVSLK
jgi:hypothetical protein